MKNIFFILALLIASNALSQVEVYVSDNFEGPFYWQAGNDNPASNDDYWGIVAGTFYENSAWCAANTSGESELWRHYADNMNSYMRRTFTGFSNYSTMTLEYDCYYETEPNHDYLRVYVNGSLKQQFHGSSNGWQTKTLNLDQYCGLESVTIEFRFVSNNTNNHYHGAFVDNFKLSGTPILAPNANFYGNPTSGVAPLTVNFTNTSTGTITSYFWEFGDGTTSTSTNPSKTYNIPGAYTVKLTATGPGGAHTKTRNNYITVSYAPPVANFSGSPRSGVAPLTVNFNNTSTETITSYFWEFGDGTTSISTNPSKTYNIPGTYTVKLTATGPGGSDTKTRDNYITVSQPTGNLSVTVNNIPGGDNSLPGNNGVIKLWNSSGDLVATTNTNNNIASFNNIPTGSGYFYRVFHNTSATMFGEEFWGDDGGVSITEGNTTIRTFERNRPHAIWDVNESNVHTQLINLETGEFVTWGEVPLGTPLQIKLTAKNPNNSTQSVKKRLVLKRDGSVVKDETSGSVSISSNGTHQFTFNYTPTQLGAYHIASAVLVDLLGNYVPSDGSLDSDVPFFSVYEPTGNLSITVNNIPGGDNSLPGNNGTVKLWNSSGDLVATTSTNNNIASFNNIPTGSGYFYRVFHNTSATMFGEEFWGDDGGVSITEGNTTIRTFERNRPHAIWDVNESNVHTQLINLETGEFVTWGEVPLGTPLQIKLTAKNPNNSTQSVKKRLVLKRDGSVVKDETSGSVSISSNGTHQFTFNYTPTQLGAYHIASAVLVDLLGNYVPSDGSLDSDVPFFTVVEMPGTISGTALEGSVVNLLENNSVYAKSEVINGQFIFEDIPVGSYEICSSKIGYISSEKKQVDITPENSQININIDDLAPRVSNLKNISAWIVDWFYEPGFNSFSNNKEVFSEIMFHNYKLGDGGSVLPGDSYVDPYELRQEAHDANIALLATIGAPYGSQLVNDMISDPVIRNNHITNILDLVVDGSFEGIDINYEGIPSNLSSNFSQFIEELSNLLNQYQKMVSVTVEVESAFNGQDYSIIAGYADKVRIQCYNNYHGLPVESYYHSDYAWVSDIISGAKNKVDSEKIIAALPFYGHQNNIHDENALYFESVHNIINTQGVVPDADIIRDAVGYVPYFSYEGNDLTNHVKYEDAISIQRKLDIVFNENIDGVSFWVLGGEDPGVFSKFQDHLEGLMFPDIHINAIEVMNESFVNMVNFTHGDIVVFRVHFSNSEGSAPLDVMVPVNVRLSNSSVVVFNNSTDGEINSGEQSFIDVLWEIPDDIPAGFYDVASSIRGDDFFTIYAMSEGEDGIWQNERLHIHEGDVADYDISMQLYRISDTSGDEDSPNPGNEKTSFLPGEMVRVTFSAVNTGDPVYVQTVLNIRNPNGQWVYDSDQLNENSFGIDPENPLGSEMQYYSFDWQIPDEGAVFGEYDIGGSIRDAEDFEITYETTCEGANTGFVCEWVLENEYEVMGVSNEILAVPYISSQNTNWCALSSLSMILAYNSVNKKPWEIAQFFNYGINDGFNYLNHNSNAEAYINAVMPDNAEYIIKKETFNLSKHPTSIERALFKLYLMTEISHNRPVMLGSHKKGHTVVVVGANQDNVYFHDPSGGLFIDGSYSFLPDLVAVEKDWESFLGLLDVWFATQPFGGVRLLSISNSHNLSSSILTSDIYPTIIKSGDWWDSIKEWWSSLFGKSPNDPFYQGGLKFTNKLYNVDNTLYLTYDGKSGYEFGYRYTPFRNIDGEWEEMEPVDESYYIGDFKNNYHFSASLGDRLYFSPQFSNSSQSSLSIFTLLNIYELDSSGMRQSNTPIFGREKIITVPAYEQERVDFSTTNDPIKLGDILDVQNNGTPDNPYRYYEIELIIDNPNILDINQSFKFTVDDQNTKYASISLAGIETDQVINIHKDQNNIIPFSFTNNGTETENINIHEMFPYLNDELISFDIHNTDSDGNPVGESISNSFPDIHPGQTSHFCFVVTIDNGFEMPESAGQLQFRSSVDDLERIYASPTLVLKENHPTEITYNSEPNQWYSKNMLLDINFSDGNSLANIQYQLNSNSNINPENWSNLTTDGTTEITEFSGPEFTDLWMISDADWDALPLNHENQGWHYIYFKVMDAVGNDSITLSQAEAFRFGKDIHPPTCNFLFPSQGQVLNTNAVNVSWTASDAVVGLTLSGIDKAYYALNNDSDFTEVDGSQTSVTFTGLEEGDHTVYLYVTDHAGNQSDVRTLNFTVNTHTTPPTAFALLAPAHNATVTTLYPQFTWEASSDPHGSDITYELWYAYNASFEDKVVVPNIQSTSYIPSNPLQDNSYVYWKVKAVSASGLYTWSQQVNRRFIINKENEAPLPFSLIEPANQQTLTSLTPYFSWSNSFDPDPGDYVTYHLWISTNSNFSNYAEYVTENSNYTLSAPLNPNTVYYWKVKAVDTHGAHTWSNQTNWWFTTPNTAPVLSWTGQEGYELSGVNPDIGDPSTSFEFRITYSDADGDPPAAGYPKMHLFGASQPLDGSPFEMTAYDSESFELGRIYTVTIDDLEPGKLYSYYFSAVDQHGASAGGDGTTPASGPVVNSIELLVPAGGQQWYALEERTLKWLYYGVFTSFDLAYSSDGGSSWEAIANDLDPTSAVYDWTVPDNPTADALVKVTGHYDGGSVSATSAATFEILEPLNPPQAFSLLSPYDVELDITEPTFTWEASASPVGSDITYELWLARNTQFNNPIIYSEIEQTSFTPEAPLLDNSTYYWRVRAIDEDGLSTWANEMDWFFYINTENTPPSAFALVPPDQGSTLTILQPTFSWDASYDPDPNDVITYTLWIGEDSNYADGTYTAYPGIEETSFTLPDPLVDDNIYYWKVKAVDNHGAFTWSIPQN
ncbi:MAG: PKD domain-containing protein, partial [Bacteroidales bacterium]